ncbi:SDR family oxidoreductase [Chitinophaga nivalis]|uniref:SDR family oxidoreductase n=1 Tax=Chitinophaga nivalis TaxID=2991709 RepID=A0ABT3ITL7_9BACT|nr:SDR family oxidoreductase [Chitinophaga nivalis]MCW3462988.1 SDR family oxidoreductase [Chitinophaga nivalis]MCW3487322.1 SDR family oxidoreductase [Chitinophaga nivalis]
MQAPSSNILLTGVTGILGRHILYELLPLYVSHKKYKIIVVIRDTKTEDARQRLHSLLSSLYRPDYLNQFSLAELSDSIEIIPHDIIDLNEDDFNQLKKYAPVTVIHAAAVTNLSNTPQAYEELHHKNYTATLRFLEWVNPVLSKFIFIGTAFSIGHFEGIIHNNYQEFSTNTTAHQTLAGINRNPYEMLKSNVESKIITYCNHHHKKWQLLRPSIISGRLMDAPLYFSPKFNVFYEFGKFFYVYSNRMKTKSNSIRMVANHQGTLNIIPVDFVAKTITRVFCNDDIYELNIVSSHGVKLDYLLPHTASIVGFQCELVEQVPTNMNDLEAAYYRLYAPNLTPYIQTPCHQFNTAQLRTIMSDIPEIDVQEAFKDLLGYALQHGFRDLH